MRVFENMVLRRIFRPKRDEITWEWRKVHSEELNDLYSSPNILCDQAEKNEINGHVAREVRGGVHTAF